MSAMKISGGALALLASAHGIKLDREQSPVHEVIDMLTTMKAQIEGEGASEQSSYDKYACWCEDIMARKAKDIDDHKALLTETQAEIIKLKGETGSRGAEIDQLTKDIAANKKAQDEATGVRDGENDDYTGKKTEAEQCMGALEAAVKALSGAGSKAFLQTSQDVELLSVVGGLRNAMEKSGAMSQLSSSDAQALQHFIEHPGDFAAHKSGASALQVGNNSPFGDYAPQSDQISGILKGMYDTFATDLEKANADEANGQKAFEDLMDTKDKELKTLQDTLDAEERDHAGGALSLTENRELLDSTKEQLEADEAFFKETKASCKTKAIEWNNRSGMRTLELQGVAKAIEILSSDEAQATFLKSTTTFVQISAQRSHRSSSQNQQLRHKVLSKLGGLAHRYHDFAMVQLAVQLRSGGHFDKVITSIDMMIKVLREEEQDDIAHRDMCQNKIDDNKQTIKDLGGKTDQLISKRRRMTRKKTNLVANIKVVEDEMADIAAQMKQALDLRNEETEAFRQALSDDNDAIGIMKQALKAVRSFYEKSGVPMSLIADPEYTVDPDKAPEMNYEGSYGGKTTQTTGIVATMNMLIEDMQKEMDVARIEEEESQKAYLKQLAAMQRAYDAAEATKISLEKELEELEEQIIVIQTKMVGLEGDTKSENSKKVTIDTECAWVSTHFDSRREKRKAEMAGLEEAKSYLAGVEKGDDI